MNDYNKQLSNYGYKGLSLMDAIQAALDPTVDLRQMAKDSFDSQWEGSVKSAISDYAMQSGQQMSQSTRQEQDARLQEVIAMEKARQEAAAREAERSSLDARMGAMYESMGIRDYDRVGGEIGGTMGERNREAGNVETGSATI